jgi:hypothetical protein
MKTKQLHLLIFLAFLITPFYSICQMDSLQNRKRASMLSFTVENDLFLPAHTDRYYTNGFEIGYFTNRPFFKNRITTAFSKPNGQNVFGIILNSQMYSPLHPILKDIPIVAPSVSNNLIEKDNIKNPEKTTELDRPYAGLLTASLRQEFNDPTQATRITTFLTLGMMGPAAQQAQVQDYFHKILKRPLQNWDNQIPNDLAFNVNIKMEKRLVKPCSAADIIGSISANAGTVTNYLKMGGLVRLGLFNDYFQGSLKQNEEISLFFSPNICFFYDQALLEGGFTTRSAHNFPYTIPREQMKHFYYDMQFGASINIKKVKIIYTQNLRSPEFLTALNSYWGSIGVSVYW